MRNMSFSLTTEQFRNRTKTVTRRLGWWHLKPGDVVMGCVKCMGLGKGGRIETIHPFRVKLCTATYLNAIKYDDCVKEGFPEKTPAEFVKMFCEHNGCAPGAIVNRIEFDHIPESIKQ